MTNLKVCPQVRVTPADKLDGSRLADMWDTASWANLEIHEDYECCRIIQWCTLMLQLRYAGKFDRKWPPWVG